MKSFFSGLLAGVVTIVSVIALPAATVEIKSANRYCGSGGFISKEEVINYARKEVEETSINGGLPCYGASATTTNCANIAGAVVIGYYDRLYENLVPGYKTYIQIGSVIKYRDGGNYIINVINSLYDLMDTDKYSAGTTFNGFQKGMASYVSNQEYNYASDYINAESTQQLKNSFDNEKPVVLFLSAYSIAEEFHDTGTAETVTYKSSTVAHVVTACGYKFVKYYNNSNILIATRTYLKISNNTGNNLSYLCLNGKSIIDESISVSIH